MTRSSLPLLLALIVAGCAPPSQSVRVDLDRIPVSRLPETTDFKTPEPPAPSPEIRVQIPGLKQDVLEDPSHANQESVAKTIENQQRTARTELEKRLRAVYAEEVRLFQLQVNRDLDRGRPAAYEEANERISERFQRYADEWSPLAAELYDIVGFPDPNPQSLPPKRALGNVAQGRYDRAAALRKQLAAVDAAYDEDKAAILREAQDKLSVEEAKALTRVQELADQLERKAKQEAFAQVQISVQDLGLQLADSQPIVLNATPSQSVQIPAERPLPPAPQVPSSDIPNSLKDQRARMERDLQIWLQVNRYRLDPNARDATAEFEQWRKRHGVGL